MSIEVKITIRDKAVKEMIANLERYAHDLLPICDKNAKLHFEGPAKRKVRQVLHVRTGRLRQSIEGGAVVKEKNIIVYLGVDKVVYAPVHEFGTEIKPRRARLLAIPTEISKTRADVHRYPSPRFRKDLYFDKKNLVLRERKTGRVAYILKPRVKIPERPYLRPVMEERAPRFLKAVFEKELAGYIKK